MADRPYPRRDRALAQLRRQNPALRFRSTPNRRSAPDAAATLERAGEILVGFVRSVRQRPDQGLPVDEYRLSTR